MVAAPVIPAATAATQPATVPSPIAPPPRLEGNDTALRKLLLDYVTRLFNLLNNLQGALVPVGSIINWPAPSSPRYYLPCDGRAVSRTQYAALFQQLGTTWGAGDGATTFNIPLLTTSSVGLPPSAALIVCIRAA